MNASSFKCEEKTDKTLYRISLKDVEKAHFNILKRFEGNILYIAHRYMLNPHTIFGYGVPLL